MTRAIYSRALKCESEAPFHVQTSAHIQHNDCINMIVFCGRDNLLISTHDDENVHLQQGSCCWDLAGQAEAASGIIDVRLH